MPDTTTITKHKYIPEGYEAPTTVRDALIVGKAILEEDKSRWTQGGLFKNPHPEVDPSTPFCNSWGVCALGAVAVAVLGAVPMDFTSCRCEFCSSGWRIRDLGLDETTMVLWHSCISELDTATQQTSGKSSMVAFNDGAAETVDQVLAVFDRAIENLS